MSAKRFMVYVALIVIGLILLVSMTSGSKYRLTSILKDKNVFTSLNKGRFTLTINYHTSSILKYKSKKLIAINATILNKEGYNMNNMQVTTVPAHQAVDYNDVTIQDEKSKRKNILSPLKFKPLNAQHIDVEAGQMISGYLLFEAPNNNCDIDKLIISYDGQIEEIVVRKSQIFDESRVQLLV